MPEYKNNDATQLVEDNLFTLDFENDEFPGKEYIISLNTVSTFADYVLLHAKRLGFSLESNDWGKLVAFITNKCEEAKVNISRQTLVNWLTKGLPANTPNGRENVYRLCFALQMDALQTKEFFLKAYLERPFNYKDLHEAVYFFCLNNELKYIDALRIINTIEKTPKIENPYADNITAQIGERLSEIKNEEELIRYLAENHSGFIFQNQTATAKIEQMIESCKKIAPKEYAITHSNEKEITVDNIDELLSVIYGYSARATEDAKLVFHKSISKSSFPELIRRNWPQREQLEQITKKKNATYDVIRRALIMLTFYDFAANATVNNALDGGIFDEFTDEMNLILSDGGYVQLYWRNPYDWMIGYCAMSPNPIGTLRDLIEEFYLSDPEVIDQIEE